MKKPFPVMSIVMLVGAYIACQLIADIGATKMIEVAGIVMPAGTFIFAVTFTLRDMVHKRLGHEWARAAIYVAALMNLVMAAYLVLMSKLPAPVFFGLGDAWNSIFAIVPSITIGSIAAELVSELTDTEVYSHVKRVAEHWPQWTRVLISNAVSLPLDSLTFGLLAFVILPPLFGGTALPVMTALSVSFGQIVFKAIVTVVSLPGIYLVKEESII